ncbi:MAG: hypothetical protein ABI574_02435 [Burkholderiales bacterium]
MTTLALTDPFAMMMNPEAVLQAIDRSERLARLHSRICRPLDKPLISRVGAAARDFDHAIDDEPDLPAIDGPSSVFG